MNSLYPFHIPLSNFQRIVLGVSSACIALNNPYRDDMVAVCGETTACYSLKSMKYRMNADKTGKRILKDKPKISTDYIDTKFLKSLSQNTFGRQYVDMLQKYNITPDSRKPVKFVNDVELAYVLQRYREVHDFNHLILNQPTDLQGEVAVKWYEAIQTNLPMCWLAAIGGTIRLCQNKQQMDNNIFLKTWQIAKCSTFFMNVYFEEWFTEDIDELRQKMGILA